MLSKKRMLSNYNEMAESHKLHREIVEARMKNLRAESENMKKIFTEKTNTLNRLRSKSQ